MTDIEREIPPCDTRGLYFDDAGRISDRPTDLAGANPQLNDEAVFSVLQFGAIVPPLSPWTGVHRFVPGYKYRGTERAYPLKFEPAPQLKNLSPEQQADEVERLIDAILKRHIGEEKDPVLLFSGGVDSGFIAARLAALGYHDSLLVNFSFGDGDEESKLAEAMAKQLGLKFKRVTGNRHPCNCLREPGRIFPQPFGDSSTVPTSDLAYSVLDCLSTQKRLVIDGSGADGAFGMVAKVKKWERLARIPAIARKVASLVYHKVLWRRTGKIERLFRILARSGGMSFLAAMLAQNPLAGVFYNTVGGRRIDHRLETWIKGWAGETLVSNFVAADLALTCAGIFAQKAKPMFETAGHKVLFPFLEKEIVSLALFVVPHWRMDEQKAPLKRSLSRYVPAKMVYRPKSAFVDPENRVFSHPDFIAHLRAAAEDSSPISHLLRKKPIIESCELLTRKKELPVQTLNLLWAIVFTDRWYRTALQ